MSDTQQQLTASRMLTAMLHNELRRQRDYLDQCADAPDRVREIDEALNHSEPGVLAVLEDADRLAKVDRLNSAARRAVKAFMGTKDGVNATELSNAMDALGQDLLP